MTNIEISAPELSKALKIGAAIVSGNEHAPVLNNMRLSVEKGRASLAFSDLNLWLSTSVPATADAITATTIPAALFSKAAAAIEADTLALKINDKRATLSGGRAPFNMPTLPADGFPSLPESDEPEEVSIIIAGELADAISAVAYAAPGDGIMHVQAIHFEACASDEIELATYDGKRMALDQVHNHGAKPEPFNLPLKAAQALLRLCQNAPAAEVRFHVTERLAHFTCGDWQMQSALAKPDFPKYQKLLSTTDKPSLQFDPRTMERALGRLAIMADGKTEAVRFGLTRDKITLSLANHKTGEASEEVPAFYEGEEAQLGYRLGYLRDAIRNLPGDTVEMFLDRFEESPGHMATRAIFDSFDPKSSSRHFVGPYAI
jgi:DNA polymerase III subunit beta